MRREGRQHGMVRNYPIFSGPWNPRPNARYPNKFDSPPTADLFTKVSPKPTNHSKFTGKCGRPKCRGCHSHPVCKSKDKVKGALKIKSASDVVSNHRLITWRVVDSQPGLKFSGLSATGILGYLASNDYVDDDHDYESDENEDVQTFNYQISSRVFEIEEEIGQSPDDCVANDDQIEEEIDQFDDDHGANHDDDDDAMSFCEVGFVWEAMDGDDTWYMVEEI